MKIRIIVIFSFILLLLTACTIEQQEQTKEFIKANNCEGHSGYFCSGPDECPEAYLDVLESYCCPVPCVSNSETESEEPKYIPNTCLVGPGFSCEDFQVRGDGTGTIILKNGGKETISGPAMYLDATAGSCNGTSIQVGGQTTCTFTGLIATAGEKFSATLKFGYTSGAAIAHNVTGKLTVKVE